MLAPCRPAAPCLGAPQTPSSTPTAGATQAVSNTVTCPLHCRLWTVGHFVWLYATVSLQQMHLSATCPFL